MVQKSEEVARPARRRTLDLSVTQVAASALAAVVGAVLASELGVYGTIIGAAVVSTGATVGSALFQHLFRRTGEQLRDLATSGPVRPVSAVPFEQPPADFDPFDPGGERTRMMAALAPPVPVDSVAVYRGRTTWRPKGWKTYALMGVLVFGLAMGTVTVVELVAGKPVAAIVRNEPGSGTSFGGGSVEHGSGGSGRTDPATVPSTTPSGPAGGGEPSSGASSGPSDGPSDGASPTPSSTPSGSPQPSHSASATPSDGPTAGAGEAVGADPSTTPTAG
nr:hypothetical protein [Streptacidiphilus albus]